MEGRGEIALGELEKVSGGWKYEDIEPAERAEIERLFAVYRELSGRALSDSSYKDAAAAALDAWDEYTSYIQKKYDFIDRAHKI
jgi:hypothetical protein